MKDAVFTSDVDLFHKLAKQLNQPWLTVDKDCDEEFLLCIGDGTFSIHSEENPEGVRGDKIHYVVTVYTQVSGGRWNPPETVDKELYRAKSVWDALRFILIESVTNEIDAFTQAAGEAETAGFDINYL